MTLALILPIAGAAVGAGTHSSSDFQYGAEAVVVTDANVGRLAALSRQLASAAIFAEAIKLPQVAAAAGAMVGGGDSVDEILHHTSVESTSGSALVRIDVEEVSEQRAVALANALALQGMNFLRRLAATRSDGIRVVGDFEESVSDWGIVQSIFNTPPRIIGKATSIARFGSGSLRVVCPPTLACGPTVPLYDYFREGVTYTVEGYARATVGVPVTMVLGSSPKDVVTGQVRRLRGDWTRLQVSWTPRADSSFADLGFQTVWGDRRATYYIDGVSLFDPLAAADGRRLGESRSSVRRAFAQAHYAAVAPARPTGKMNRSGRTVAWGLGGALFGLAVALATIGLGVAAHRREQSEQNPNS